MVAGGVTYFVYQEYHRSSPLSEDTTVLIEKGSSTLRIATLLEEQGVVSSALVFRVATYAMQAHHRLQAGEYVFPAHVSMKSVIEMLVSGDVVQHMLTVPEGLMSFQILELLKNEPLLTGELPEMVAEGSLLPESYRFSRGDTRADVLLRMQKAMDATLAELWAARDSSVPLASPEEAVILASIVEKETGIAAERKRVAAVFVNRLRIGMALQTDPTVIYALTQGKKELGRPLLRKDLKTESPYNTYLYVGLPPTPIANPGRESIEAVLHPLQTKELFFVADGTGGHVFSETLKGHNRNVANWRAIQKSR